MNAYNVVRLFPNASLANTASRPEVRFCALTNLTPKIQLSPKLPH